MQKKPLLLGLVVLSLVACAPAGTPSPTATQGPAPLNSPLEELPASQEISIVYHRSGGFAGTDDTWKISVNGMMSYQGQTAGTPEQLTTEQWAELTAAVHAANFMALDESYVPKNTCCDRYLYEITVTMGGQSKTVRTIDASPTAPVELTQLIGLLNRMVATPSPEVK
jgi:hypothetical protein